MTESTIQIYICLHRQPEFGGWAFNLQRGKPCHEKWVKIPEGVDILITHGPPLDMEISVAMDSELVVWIC